MRRAALALIALLLASITCAAAKLEPQPDGPAPACAIEIEFRERGGEIDTRTLDRVLRFVEFAPAVSHAYDARRPAGAPSALCLVIEGQAEALAVFEQLTILVPPQRARLPRLKPPPAVVLRYTSR